MNDDALFWRQKTIEHLLMSGKRLRTAQTYAREIPILSHFIGKPLDTLTEDDLRKFIMHRYTHDKLSGSSMRILYCGIKALYQDVMKNPWPLFETLKARRDKHIPIVICRNDIKAILDNALTPAHMTYLRTVYSCGLRLSEARFITINDVDGTRGLLLIRNGKGGKGRMVPLPNKTYRFLRRYWSLHRNPLYIFPALGRSRNGGPTATEPMSVSSVQAGLHRAVKRAGLSRRGIRMHTLRHSYATHLLESGLSIKVVQENLGHASLQHTLIYLHLTNWGKEDAYATINTMMTEV